VVFAWHAMLKHNTQTNGNSSNRSAVLLMAHQQRGQLRNATFIGIGPVLSKMLQRKHFWFLFNFEHRCDHVNVMNNESHYIHYITVINVFKEKTSITLQELNAIEKMSFQSTSENRQ